jgi:predicted acylesterase/phospholipase RssA
MSNLPSAYIAFQGGGALGMAHLGAWREVSQQFNIIGTAGTSAGSIVSALCAAGFNCAHTIDLFYELNWSKYVNRQSFLKLVTEQDAYSDGKLFHKWLRSQLGKNVPGKPSDITFADLYQFRKIYLAIIACDLNNQKGDPVVFDKDTEPHTTISFAVRASISIPGLFKPMSRLDRRQELVDGGVLLNFPVSPLYQQAKKANCPLVGVRFKQHKQYLESPKVKAALKGTVDLMMRRGSLPPEDIAQDPSYIDIEIDVSEFKALEFNLTTQEKEKLVKLGAEAADRALDKYKLRILEQKDDLLEKNRAAEVDDKIKEFVTLDKGLDLVKLELKSRPDPEILRQRQRQDAVDWLSTNKKTLAKRAGKEALNNFSVKSETSIERFYLEIELYLELICRSLQRTTKKTNSLRISQPQSLSNSSIYVEALNAVKNKIPIDLDRVEREEIEYLINYLQDQIT